MAAAARRTGVLVVRIWHEPEAGSAPRIRVTAVTSVEDRSGEADAAFADVADAAQFVGDWLSSWHGDAAS